MASGLDLWKRRLEFVAEPAIANTPLSGTDRAGCAAFVDGFRDEMGHCRTVDRPLLSRLLGMHPGPTPVGLDPDDLLWWALHDPGIDPWAAITGDSDSLVERGDEIGLEVWTETEMCGTARGCGTHRARTFRRRSLRRAVRGRDRGGDEPHEHRLRIERSARQLRMELPADEVRVRSRYGAARGSA
jgi:hypothetical protein